MSKVSKKLEIARARRFQSLKTRRTSKPSRPDLLDVLGSCRSFSRIGGSRRTGLEGCTTPRQGAKISLFRLTDDVHASGARRAVAKRRAGTREKGGHRVDWYEVSWLTRRNNGSKLAREVGVSSHHRVVNPPHCGGEGPNYFIVS